MYLATNRSEKSCGKMTQREAQAGGWLSRTQGKWGRVLLVSTERGRSLNHLSEAGDCVC